MTVAEGLKAINIKHLDRLFIGGAWVEPSSGGLIEVVSPVTEEVIFKVAEAREADMDRAVAAARVAFDEGPWPRMTHAERAGYMRRLGEGLMRRFFAAWVRKVALAKASGVGLGGMLGSGAGFGADRYAVTGFEPAEGHLGALAHPPGLGRLRRFTWRIT